MTTPPPSRRPLSTLQQAQQARAETVKKMSDRRVERVKRMKEDFTSLLEPEREISKDLFAANFLPYFCGEQVSTKEVLVAWLHVASSPFHAVRLVENGRTIGVVPPVQDIHAFSPISGAERRSYNAGSIVEMGAQRAGIDPVSSLGTVTDGLSQRFLTQRFEPSSNHRQAWETLLALFGKTLDPAKPLDAKAATGPSEADEELPDYE